MAMKPDGTIKTALNSAGGYLPHRASKVRAMRELSDLLPDPYVPDLQDALAANTSPEAGGHLIWTHPDRQVKIGGKRQPIQRHVFEARHGTIPPHRFLLNHCLVPNCIAPDCHMLSRFSQWSDVFRHTHNQSTQAPHDTHNASNASEASCHD